MVLLQTTVAWFSHIAPLDRKIFFLVNTRGTAGFLDTLFVFVREANLWVPLYLFLLVFALVNFGRRGSLWFIFFACTAGLSDLVASRLIKEHIFRLRPCQDPDLADTMRSLAHYCPHSSSFVSAHACTHFALAFFVVATMRRHTTNWMWLFFAWAAMISYAQVYVGVHYPFDVLCGALIGMGLGYFTSRIFNNYVGLISLQHKLS
ncbi:MAG: phosphatase PAP2 family protein [Bacteroidetes bacterium]|nr:phosphatase PAP2 family protein [Bacteroidota bacterium]